MTELLIRRMAEADLGNGFFEALSALSPTTLAADAAAIIYWQRSYAGIQTYVAVRDNRVVGTAALFLERKFIHDGGLVGHIEDVSVVESEQHHGIGAALVKHLLDTCKAARCYKVILDCEEHNIPFYEKLGFRVWETAMRVDLP